MSVDESYSGAKLHPADQEIIRLRARVAELEGAIRTLDATDTAYRHTGLGDPGKAYADLINLVR